MIAQGVGRALRTDRSNFYLNLLSKMAESSKQGEPRNGERGANSRTSAPELDGVQMWSAPTSNVRGVNEAEEAAVAGPSAPVRNRTDSLNVQTSKGRPQVCQSFWTAI